jgi:anti-sigma B factor antagonist
MKFPPLQVRWVGPNEIALGGVLDLATTKMFFEAIPLPWSQGLVLDLSELEFCDSSGIAALLHVAKNVKETVVLRNPRTQVRKVLDLVGIDKAPNLAIDPPK